MDRTSSARESLSEDEDIILAPENFSMVENGVYRSAFPRVKNQSFLLNLGIKTIIPLVPEDYPATMIEFCTRNGIKLMNTCGVDGNKWPFKEIDADVLSRALLVMMHWTNATATTPGYYTNRPCLIHCNKGKHRTGSLIGSLRKLRGWGLSSIVSEYQGFALPKARLEDQRFIEAFDIDNFRLLQQNEYQQQQQLLSDSQLVISNLIGSNPGSVDVVLTPAASTSTVPENSDMSHTQLNIIDNVEVV